MGIYKTNGDKEVLKYPEESGGTTKTLRYFKNNEDQEVP